MQWKNTEDYCLENEPEGDKNENKGAIVDV